MDENAARRTRAAAYSATASYVHLIVNEGPLAGASLEHSHAQLYALPFVPAEIARERERFNAYHERTQGSHLLQDVVVDGSAGADLEHLVELGGRGPLNDGWPVCARTSPPSARPWGAVCRSGRW